MRKIILTVALLSVTFTPSFAQTTGYQGSEFNKIWDQMSSDQYKNPKNKISFSLIKLRYFS